MIIKRYIVDSMNEAMIKIRYELGNDAIIVSQRKIRQKGFTGFMKPKKLEVTAAVDEKSKKPKETSENKEEIQKEINELKALIQGLMSQNEKISETKAENKKDSKNKMKQRLMDNDISIDIIEEIFKKLKETGDNKRLTAKTLEREIATIVEEMIMIDEGIQGRIQVLVGPTGVGKTTTIAKLASLYTLYKNKKVGLITYDTYRIGAVEQLRTYAEILGVPFGVVLSNRELPEALNKMNDCEIVFVDTTGRSSKNIMQISETRKLIEEINPDKIHLVLSMTTKQKDIKRIIENYRIVNFNSLILTKVDETDVYGSILASVFYSGAPVSYISTGQNVPEDIEEAKKEKLSKLVLGAEE